MRISPDYTAIKHEYYAKSNVNIQILAKAFANNFILPTNKYTLLYDKYNKSVVTSPLAMADFLMDVKRSLSSNNPTFSVRNQAAIETILNSF